MSKALPLYEILGGKTFIEAVVEDFYQRILNDERVNHHFGRLDMDHLHRHQVAFVSQLLGGPHEYSGRSMAVAHAGLGISVADFNAVAGHLLRALEDLKVPQTHIDTVISQIADLEREIVGK